jgi:hypothetical protein
LACNPPELNKLYKRNSHDVLKIGELIYSRKIRVLDQPQESGGVAKERKGFSMKLQRLPMRKHHRSI